MALRIVTAVCDACVLYPFHLRNILVQVSVDGLYDARWTDTIQDEWIRSLIADRPAIPRARLEVTKRLMNAALPDAQVDGYRRHIESVQLPDPDDRHVVAAAIEARASRILTWNLRDFPVRLLTKHGLVRQTPDAFLTELHDNAPKALVASLANARRNLSRPGVSAADFLDMLRLQRLVQLEERLRKHLRDL